MARKKETLGTSVSVLQLISGLLDTPRSSFGEIITESLKIQSGWSFPYNLDPVFVNVITTNGGTVTHEGSFAKLETGTDPNGFAEITTKRALAYTPGVGAVAKFTAIFQPPKVGCVQLQGIGNTTDGWFFGYNGLDFGVIKINNSVEEWIYQKDWNSKVFPDLDPTKGNVYQIDFQWLGFGAQYFSVEDSEGDITLAHKIKYTNLHHDVSVQNPSLPLTARIFNTGNTTNMILKTPSAVAGSYGDIDSSAFEFPIGFDQLDKATLAGTETYLFTIKNPETFLGKANRLYTIPSFLSLSADGTKSVVIRIYFNAVLTGSNFVDLANGITPIQYDLSATAFTGGLKVLTTTLGKVDRANLDVSSLRALVSPGNQVTFTALSTNISAITTGITIKSRT